MLQMNKVICFMVAVTLLMDISPARKKQKLGDIHNMAETNMMLQKKPRYPGKYYGYIAVPRSEATFETYGPSWSVANPAQRKARLDNKYIGAGRYRKRRSYRGRGMYYGGAGSYFSRMMRRQMHRTMAGQTPLGQLGKKLGRSALARAEGALMASGSGSYDLNAAAPASNNLVAGGGLSVPTFGTHDDETGSLVVQHEEYVKDIYGVPWTSNDPNTASIVEPFVNNAIALNPGLATTFPWLSQIACNYEEYELLQCMFCFKTRVGDNLTTTDGQVGTLLMFTDYNATDQPRRTKQDMLQAYGTSVAKISDNDILHGIECDPSKIKGDAHKFVRCGQTSQDKHDFDWGLFQIAVDNTPAVLSNKVIGELYVSYTVRLSKPRLFAALGLSIPQDQFLVKHTAPTNGNAVGTLVGSGESNSLGSSLELINHATLGNYTIVKVTLPASYSGALEAVVILDRINSETPTGQVSSMFISNFSGNVVSQEDLAAGGTTVPQSDVDPTSGSEYTTAVDAIADNRVVIVRHLYTTMASFGTDNTFSITLHTNNLNGGPASNYKMLIMLRRYNSLDKSSADVFKAPNGSVVDLAQVGN